MIGGKRWLKDVRDVASTTEMVQVFVSDVERRFILLKKERWQNLSLRVLQALQCRAGVHIIQNFQQYIHATNVESQFV